MREAHEEAVQKAVATFNAIAVGTGSARQKYEKCFHTLLRKAFEVIFCDVLFRLLIMMLYTNHFSQLQIFQHLL